MVCKKCCSLFLASCYGQALLAVPEDSRLSVLRRCIENTETALEDQRMSTKSLRGQLQDFKTQALERLKGDLQRQMVIYEAGIEWMRANSPLVQADIQKESEEVARLTEKRKAVESRVESVKTALEAAMKGLKVRIPKANLPSQAPL
jgi:chromosome segregation ATPase